MLETLNSHDHYIYTFTGLEYPVLSMKLEYRAPYVPTLQNFKPLTFLLFDRKRASSSGDARDDVYRKFMNNSTFAALPL